MSDCCTCYLPYGTAMCESHRLIPPTPVKYVAFLGLVLAGYILLIWACY